MITNSVDISKLPDAHLREFVTSGRTDTETVIIQVNVPTPKISMARDAGGRLCSIIQPQTTEEAQHEVNVAETLQSKLAKVVKGGGNYIPSTRAFVVNVNPAQLENILNWNEVSVIRMNGNKKLSINF